MNTFGGAVVCLVIDVMKPLLSPRLLRAAPLPEQQNTSKSLYSILRDNTALRASHKLTRSSFSRTVMQFP
jgi:hypothetical protein